MSYPNDAVCQILGGSSRRKGGAHLFYQANSTTFFTYMGDFVLINSRGSGWG